MSFIKGEGNNSQDILDILSQKFQEELEIKLDKYDLICRSIKNDGAYIILIDDKKAINTTYCARAQELKDLILGIEIFIQGVLNTTEKGQLISFRYPITINKEDTGLYNFNVRMTKFDKKDLPKEKDLLSVEMR